MSAGRRAEAAGGRPLGEAPAAVARHYTLTLCVRIASPRIATRIVWPHIASDHAREEASEHPAVGIG
jgi:hypothetical protein